MDDTEKIPGEYSCDFISRLSHEMLCSILERLPLDEAVRTGVLSHRWKDLWKYTAFLDVKPLGDDDDSRLHRLISGLSQFVRLHQAERIQLFSVRFTYNPDMSAQVDSWVLFAINKHVRELHLDFDVGDDNVAGDTDDGTRYELHPCAFTSGSLVHQELKFCALKLPSLARLSSLKVLTFHRIELPDDAVEMITSNSPVLQQLSLLECNRTRDLFIHVAPNRRPCTVMIEENSYDVNPSSRMDIRAPGVEELFFLGSLPRFKYRITDKSACLHVNIILHGKFVEFLGEEQHDQDQDQDGNQLGMVVNELVIQRHEEALRELLASLQDAAVVHRAYEWSIRLLSLSKVQDSEPLSLNCTYIELSTCLQKWDLPGIIFILKSCRKVEKLVILTANIDENMEASQLTTMLMQHDYEESGYITSQIQCFEGHFENLRTVEFKNTAGDYQSWEHGCFDLHGFFSGSQGVHLLNLLNKSSKLEYVAFAINNQKQAFRLKNKENGCWVPHEP